ncbi:uncharacterized protein DSM5745_07906 [Aspergillus mulundensis]|uniref:F-box domain-containing protein n=1 Tax=Aspergillus mulundensis TaxID=1810919 RepID=A0A3D8RFT6_9EURO|nr:hypothetical protein DSM5745_07906 [Aspergillus mulundensis]RDW72734.1 hypothetical protein DSM5745_07906 [Aspergillus mulundensis]
MDKLPLEVFHSIIEYAVEDNPLQDTFGARLVNRHWNDVVTKELIRSPRLEGREGLHLEFDERNVSANYSWASFPYRLKMLYLMHRVKHHEKNPCHFTTWMQEMRQFAEAWDGDDEENWQKTLLKLLDIATASNAGTRFLYHLSPDSPELEPIEITPYRNIPNLHWVKPFEPLEKTFKIMLAFHAIHHGNTRDLFRLLREGHDLTARSTRFRLSALGDNATVNAVASEEIADILCKFGGPFRLCSCGSSYVFFESTSLDAMIDSGNRKKLERRLKTLHTRFRGFLPAVLKGARRRAEENYIRAKVADADDSQAEQLARWLDTDNYLAAEMTKIRHEIRDAVIEDISRFQDYYRRDHPAAVRDAEYDTGFSFV